MCKAMEDRIDRKRAEEKRSAALRMLQAGKYTLEEIADIAGITLEEVKKLRNTL